jgi:hypothetical protein
LCACRDDGESLDERLERKKVGEGGVGSIPNTHPLYYLRLFLVNGMRTTGKDVWPHTDPFGPFGPRKDHAALSFLHPTIS